MGCAFSRIDQEERVRVCRDRKRLMKQLLRYRHEFANAQLAYLRSLKNTGATLRQFTESESLEVEDPNSGFGFVPSSPPALPPSPPPPPTFSPDLRKFENRRKPVQEIVEIGENGGDSPPPPGPSSSWEYWDPFAPMPQCESRNEASETEDENWADTKTEFVDEEEEEEAVYANEGVNNVRAKREIVELIDDNVSVTSSQRKEGDDLSMVVWRGKKTLSAIVKDLDEYFLKASVVVKDIAVFIDLDCSGTFAYQTAEDSKRRRSSSAKVFSALTWSWSSKSLLSNKETGDVAGSGEPCKPGAHCFTLERLYSEEQKLYKDVKDEEIAKMEHGRKSVLLQRQEEEHDLAKAEKTHLNIENLLAHILALQDSIGRSYSNILKLINEELHPQLITLASGLMQMWQTMHSCHQVQLHISRHLNRVTELQNAEPTREYHRQAAGQLHTEVTSWYQSFCKLVKFQHEYVRALCKWTKLTDCVKDTGSPNGNSSAVRTLSRKWLQALDTLPDKIVSDAINELLSAIQAIIVQQQEERNMHKRAEKLERKLLRELSVLSEVEMKSAGSSSSEGANSVPTTKHPLVIRRAKVEVLKKLVEDEKAKCASAVKTTRTMILNNLQMNLPKVFQALVVYSDAYVQSFEVLLGNESVSGAEETTSGAT